MKINIQIKDERIVLKVPISNFEQIENNSIVIERNNGRIVALGESKDKIQEIMKSNENYESRQVFSVSNFEPQYALHAISYFYKYLIGKGVKGISLFIVALFNIVELSIDFPTYNLIDNKLRKEFETMLNKKLRLRNVLINGIKTGK